MSRAQKRTQQRQQYDLKALDARVCKRVYTTRGRRVYVPLVQNLETGYWKMSQ